MLSVKTPEEVMTLLKESFPSGITGETVIPLSEAPGRVLCEAVTADEYIPGFDRSSVDGYAVRAADTFGCSDAIPALLAESGEILMGESAGLILSPGECAAIPTGGAVPAGADAVVMIEYTEDYGDGTIGILKSVSPGENMVFRGDDLRPGTVLLPKGRMLSVPDIGALAAMGMDRVRVFRKPLVGIISTGDELVPVSETPAGGQIRDVNSSMLAALAADAGADVRSFGILKDDENLLGKTLDAALSECDLVLLSGGSSVGIKDAALRVIESRGEVLLHGIAMKPGKPTIIGRIGGKPVFGLPGHPVAAFFVSDLFVRPLIGRLMGRSVRIRTVPARITEAVSANHGRAQYMGVFLSGSEDSLSAVPVRSKSGLITAQAGSDGYFCIPRDCEGVPAGAEIRVKLYTSD